MFLEFLTGLAGTVIGVVGLAVAFAQLRRTPRPDPLAAQTDPGVSRLEPVQVRHNLPPRGVLIGRVDERNRVLEGIDSLHLLVSIEGIGGMGKTALARDVAWEYVTNPLVRAPRFEAIVWAADMGGTLTLNKILDLIAEVLGYPYIPPLPTEQKKNEVFRQLQRWPTLLVLDNLDTLTDRLVAEFISEIPEPPCRVLVTSRERVTGDIWVVPIGGLGEADSLAFLRNEGKRLSVAVLAAGDDAALVGVSRAAGGNPLAMRLAAAQIRDAAVPLGQVVADLIEAKNHDVLTTLFDRCWNEGLQADQAGRMIAMTLSFFSGSAPQEALEVGSGMRGANFRHGLRRLMDLALAEVTGHDAGESPRLQMHTLARSFVRRELAVQPTLERECKERLTQYYLVLATKVSDPYRDDGSMLAFELEQENLLAFADLAFEMATRSGSTRDWLLVLRYGDALSAPLWSRGLWDDRLRLSERAVMAAQRLRDAIGACRHLAIMGRVQLWRSNLNEAKRYFAECEAALSTTSSDVDHAIPKRLRAQIATVEGDYVLAETLLAEILEVAPITVDDSGRAATLVELGLVAERRGQLTLAIDRYAAALRLDDQLGTIEGQAISLSRLGEASLKLRRNDHALAYFQRGIALALRVGRISAQARCQIGLARLYAIEGNISRAGELARDAERTYMSLGMNDMAARARQIGRDALAIRSANQTHA